MRAADIIRQVLDMIDAIDCKAAPAAEPEISVEIVEPETDELARMRQIAGLLSTGDTTYSNEPQEKIASIEAVTTAAGGGVNGPKNARDLRGNSFPIYPEQE